MNRAQQILAMCEGTMLTTAKDAIQAASVQLKAMGVIVDTKSRVLNGPKEFLGYQPKISWSGPGYEVSFDRPDNFKDAQWQKAYKIMNDVFRKAAGTANVLTSTKDNYFHGLKFEDVEY